MSEQKCPKCGSRLDEQGELGTWIDFQCGSTQITRNKVTSFNQTEVCALRQRVQTLESALRPFAEVGVTINRFRHYKETDSLWCSEESQITVADLRRASTALDNKV